MFFDLNIFIHHLTTTIGIFLLIYGITNIYSILPNFTEFSQILSNTEFRSSTVCELRKTDSSEVIKLYISQKKISFFLGNRKKIWVLTGTVSEESGFLKKKLNLL